MSALPKRLQLVEQMPISRPVYGRPDLLNHYEDWVAVNRDLLQEWFLGGHERDFNMFCRDQFAREQDRQDAHKETYRGP
jgi:hypothetical protein